MQFTKTNFSKEFLVQEDVKINLQLQQDWHEIAHNVKWQGLAYYIQKPCKSLQWPMEASVALARSKMKYSNHDNKWFDYIFLFN